jgi:hypothetical protein
MSHIQSALERVRARIAEACLRARRAPSEVTLIAVSKTFPPEAVLEAMAAGQRDFGENRVEEAIPKIAMVDELLVHTQPSTINQQPTNVHWHLIGHVQSRKAKDAIGCFDLIHSIDSFKLAHKMNDRLSSQSSIVDPQSILLECNVSGETSKEGFLVAGWEHDRLALDAFVRAVEQVVALPHLRVCGLMTMAPLADDPEQARPYFASLRALRDALRERCPGVSWDHLSMGMTDDFEVAVAEGATMVRIGRAIFGARG